MAKHRKFTAKFKAIIVLEILDGKCSATEVKPQVWLEAQSGLEAEDHVPGQYVQSFESETADSQQALELEIAEKDSQLVSVAWSRNGRDREAFTRCPVKAGCQTISYSPASLSRAAISPAGNVGGGPRYRCG